MADDKKSNDKNFKALLAEQKRFTEEQKKATIALNKLAEIEEEEGGDPEPRASKVLSGMGFSDEMMSKPTSQLSGGWRMRVSISCALFASPSLLLVSLKV